jgi:hypothetical protein
MPWPMTVWTTEVEARVLVLTVVLPSQPGGEGWGGGGGTLFSCDLYGQFQLLVNIIYSHSNTHGMQVVGCTM